MQSVAKDRHPVLPRGLLACGIAIIALGATALANDRRGRQMAPPPLPKHRFIQVDGIPLHYIDQGSGPPVVLLHGTGSMAEDFVASGVVDRLAVAHRVIAFDRPGFGYSGLPRLRPCTVALEARLIAQALRQLGVQRAVIAAHSSGVQAALALALDAPECAGALVLLAGYLFPRLRWDMLAACVFALPLLRDAASLAVSRIFGWLVLPSYLRAVFAPSHLPEGFLSQFPVGHILRSGQLRSSLRCTVTMNWSALGLERRYRSLDTPVWLLAGTRDAIVESARHSARFHAALPHSGLRWIEGSGHMVHHAAPEAVCAAIAQAGTAQRTATMYEL